MCKKLIYVTLLFLLGLLAIPVGVVFAEDVVVYDTGPDDLVRFTDGVEIWRVDVSDGYSTHVHIGPDGNVYLVAVRGSGGHVEKFDAETGASLGLTADSSGDATVDRTPMFCFGPDISGDGIADMFTAHGGVSTNAVQSWTSQSGYTVKGTWVAPQTLFSNGAWGIGVGPDVTGDGIEELFAVDGETGSVGADSIHVLNGATAVEEYSFTLTSVNRPHGIVMGSDGRMYVNSRNNDSVVSYLPDGTDEQVFSNLDGMNYPMQIAEDSSGTWYVANRFNTTDATNATVTAFTDNFATFDRVVTEGAAGAYFAGVASFDVPGKEGPAKALDPINGATDVPRDTILSWIPGEFAAGHDVYFGTDFNDVNEATTASPEFKGNQTETTYTLDRLEFGQTYYWRIDEVNDAHPDKLWKGDVWQFEVEPVGYLVPQDLFTATASSQNSLEEDPNNTIGGVGLNPDGSHSDDKTTMWLSALSDLGTAWIRYDLSKPQKLNEMLVWNQNTDTEEDLGYGIKDALIEVSADGNNFTSLGTVELAQAAETTVALQGAIAQSVRITAQNNWGDLINKFGLSAVRLYAMPMAARELSPADGDANVDPTTAVLTWRAGREVDVHNVYLSTDEQAVIDGTAPVVTLPEALYAPDLALDTTNYWRVDEVNDLEDPAVWAGSVQSFSTTAYFVVDDMEFYKSEDGKWIWETWTDGYEIASNGALLGHGGDDMETGIVNGGSQSLPYNYGQDGAAVSEGTLPIDAQDWSKYGIQSLVLWFYEDPNNVPGQLYVKVNGAKANYTPPDHKADPPGWGIGSWKPMIVDLASLGINLSSVTSVTIGVEGGSGLIYIDDIRLYKNAPTPELVESWFEAESGTYAAPMLLYDDVDGALNASGGKYIGTAGDLGDSTGALPPDGFARYSFSVEQAGVYKVALRHGDLDGGNSVWVNIPGAEKNTTGLAAADGWVKFNWDGMTGAFFWSEIHDTDDGSTIVEFTLTAGTHTLEIARREAGACIDAIAILAVPE